MKFSFKGLDDGSVESSRRQFGSNALSPQESEGFWDKLWDNFKDPTIVILTVALVIVTVLAFFDYAEWYEGIGIAIAVFIATMVATWSEFKNENTFQRLLEDASRIQVKVFRNSGSKQVNIDELVVGDLVLLQPGDKIPADGVLVAGDLRMDQAVLNGELEHVSKRAISDDVPRPPTGNLDDENWVFRGTVVADGEAVMELVSVGDRTFYGRLAGELSAAERDSPLKVKLKKLADDISKFGTIGAILIAIAFMFQKLFMQRGLSFDTLWPYLAELSNWPALFGDAVTAVILAVVIIVVAVPEGLPMMVAIVLSLNMRKLLNDKVLVRKLLGIETAGSLNVLFSDKTGTLTKGELRASVFVTGDGNSSDSFAALSEPLRRLVGRSLKYNTIAVIDTSHGEQVKLIGADRTERALLQYVETILRDDENIGVVNEISFNGERKFSAVQLEGEFEKTLVKGAPEILLGECTHYYDEGGQVRELTDLSALNSAMASLAARSMRLLALATSDVRIDGDKKMPTPLTLVGIVALGEELRAESPQAVRQAHAAGIQVVMVTGDHKETAQAIAREVGLLNRDDAVVLTSAELDELTDEQLREMMPRLHVVARAYPHQKSRLVQAAQDLNLVGGMTGDGVNDAAALKRADVGFSMGSGTEVSKEAGGYRYSRR